MTQPGIVQELQMRMVVLWVSTSAGREIRTCPRTTGSANAAACDRGIHRLEQRNGKDDLVGHGRVCARRSRPCRLRRPAAGHRGLVVRNSARDLAPAWIAAKRRGGSPDKACATVRGSGQSSICRTCISPLYRRTAIAMESRAASIRDRRSASPGLPSATGEAMAHDRCVARHTAGPRAEKRPPPCPTAQRISAGRTSR